MDKLNYINTLQLNDLILRKKNYLTGCTYECLKEYESTWISLDLINKNPKLMSILSDLLSSKEVKGFSDGKKIVLISKDIRNYDSNWINNYEKLGIYNKNELLIINKIIQDYFNSDINKLCNFFNNDGYKLWQHKFDPVECPILELRTYLKEWIKYSQNKSFYPLIVLLQLFSLNGFDNTALIRLIINLENK